MKINSVVGGGGVKLHVREWGKVNAPPVLFVHEWSQDHLCWQERPSASISLMACGIVSGYSPPCSIVSK